MVPIVSKVNFICKQAIDDKKILCKYRYMENEIELCDQETAEVLVTLAIAGCTLEEACAYLNTRKSEN